MPRHSDDSAMEPIAVIGCAGRFPSSPDNAAYWAVLNGRSDVLRDVPPDRFDVDAFYDANPGVVGKMYTRRGGFVDDVDRFDHAFFDITAREAIAADPQQRLLLETAWAALEDATQVPSALAGSRTGVYFGLSTWDYNKILNTDVRFMDAYVAAGSTLCIAANRLSHWLNLRGPSMAVDTACSSSLVAVHMGCQSLASGETDLVVVGGANVIVSPESCIVLSQAGMLAPDGRCKTFEASADGYVRSEGCGVFVLKRLKDAQRDGDPICGVILGSAVNHNGKSNGLTAPSGPAQQAVIRDCLARAGVAPADVSYVETHGTGTRLGDPIEVGALRAVYSPPGLARPPLALGAAKAIIGHAEAAAGAAGLLKVLLAMRHECLPAQPPIVSLNPLVAQAIKDSALQVLTENQTWSANAPQRRLAAVSSFGFGGANAHVVIEGPERYLAPPAPAPAVSGLPLLLPLSAKTEPALRELARRTAAWLSTSDAQMPALSDICHTLQAGRAHWPFRIAVAGYDVAEFARQLIAFAGNDDAVIPAAMRAPFDLAFVFSGQGTLHAGVARELLAIPSFRSVLERCDALVRREAGWSMLELMQRSADDTELNQTAVAQPLLYALHCALAQTVFDWGVRRPAAVLGHSLGEFSAAWVAGVFSLEDGLRLVLERARLMSALKAPGAMLAVAASEDELRAALPQWPDDLEIACRNAPGALVLAGPTEVVEHCAARLGAAALQVRRLATSHAFHSRMMQPAQQALRDFAATISFRPPTLALVSSVTGDVITAEVDWPAHWAHQLCAPVEFARAQASLAGLAPKAVLELGAQPVLAALARQTDLASTPWATTLRRGVDGACALLQGIGRLYGAGVPIDWNAGLRGSGQRINGVPTYAFDRHRHWVNAVAGWNLLPRLHSAAQSAGLCVPGWRLHAPVGPMPMAAPTSWVILCAVGSALDALAANLRGAGHSVVTVRPVAAPGAVQAPAIAEYVCVPPDQPRRLLELLRALEASGRPARVVLSADYFALPPDVADVPGLAGTLQLAARFVTALADEGAPQSWPWLVTAAAQPVRASEPAPQPVAAALWGMFKSALAEYPGRLAGLMDLSAGDDGSAPALAACFASSGPAQVLALRAGQLHSEQLLPLPADTTPFRPRGDAAYLITGAFGGIGLLVARHLLKGGAGALLLQAQRPPTLEQQREIDEWRSQSVRIGVMVDPLTGPEAEGRVEHALNALGAPLAGIFHLAGARVDAPLAALGDNDWLKPLAAKLGAVTLLRQLARRWNVDALVYFSSIATLVGSPAQANYVAANAALEAIAGEDRAAGLPASCILWGPWAGVGAAARLDEAQQKRLQRYGLAPLDAATALAMFDQAMSAAARGSPLCVAAQADWSQLAASADHLSWLAQAAASVRGNETAAVADSASKAPPLSEAWAGLPAGDRLPTVLTILRETLDVTLGSSAQALDPSADIFQRGLDSLLLMEWLGKLQRRLGMHLYPREVYQHPTLDGLSRYLLREFEATAPSPDAPATAPTEPTPSIMPAPRAAPPTAGRSKLPSAVFLLSAPRSGSTLLRAMLAGHSRVFAPPELHLLQFQGMRERAAALSGSGLDEGLIRARMALMAEDADTARARIQEWVDADLPIPEVYAVLQAAAGERVLVDKSPSYAMSASALEQIDHWFDAPKCIHLTRDPHGMIESFDRLRMHRLFGASAGVDQASGEWVWRTCNANLLELQSRMPPTRWLRIRYEDLVEAPEATLRQLCDFLELPFEASLLTPHAADRMTDSVRPGGLQVGDPNFATRTQIDATLARVAPASRASRPLNEQTQRVAAALGYGTPQGPAPAWLSDCSESWIEVNGQRCCVCQWGPASGTPVLVLHGWQDQSATWAGVARGLARAGYRVVAPDLRHHGRNRSSPLERPTAFDFVADAHALTRALGLRRVHLLGHSFGSVIAAMLAAADHDTFASLTLVEPILPEDATSVAPADALRRHLSDLFHVETPAHHATLDAVAQRLRLGFTALPVEASQALAARIADPTPDGQVCPTLEHSGARLVAALRDIDRARYQALLATLDLPLLWLRGSHSPHRRARDDAALHASLRTARLQELDGGHNLHLDASNALSDALLAFFAPPSNAGSTQGHRATPVIEMVR